MIQEICGEMVATMRSLPPEELGSCTELFGRWAGLVLQAYEDPSRNVWMNVGLPMEICELFQLKPVIVEGLVCLFTMRGIGKEILEQGEKFTLSKDICPFQLGAIGGLYQRMFPEPQMVLRSNHLCDSREKLAQLSAYLYQKPYAYVDLPNHGLPATEEYVTRQIEGLFKTLGEFWGVEITDSQIAEVFSCANQIRENCLRINALRKKGLTPYTAKEMSFINMLLSGYVAIDREMVRISEKIVQELAAYTDRHGFSRYPEKHRLFLMYVPFLFPTEEFDRWLEGEMNICIVFDELSDVYWEPLDPRDPFRSLARRCLQHPYVGPVRRRAEAAVQLAKEFQVDGVIHPSHWGCRQLNGAIRVIQGCFAEADIPFIDLDVDLGDPRNVNFSGIKSQIEAFVDILKKRRVALA